MVPLWRSGVMIHRVMMSRIRGWVWTRGLILISILILGEILGDLFFWEKYGIWDLN